MKFIDEYKNTENNSVYNKAKKKDFFLTEFWGKLQLLAIGVNIIKMKIKEEKKNIQKNLKNGVGKN